MLISGKKILRYFAWNMNDQWTFITFNGKNKINNTCKAEQHPTPIFSFDTYVTSSQHGNAFFSSQCLNNNMENVNTKNIAHWNICVDFKLINANKKIVWMKSTRISNTTIYRVTKVDAKHWARLLIPSNDMYDVYHTRILIFDFYAFLFVLIIF